MTSGKSGKTIHSEAREVIRRVIEKCDLEARTGQLTHLLSQSNLRIQDYTGISKYTVTAIRKEAKSAENTLLTTPGKKRKRPEDRNVVVDSFDRRVIRDIIQHFYTVEKRVPTCPKLLAAVKEKINFPWGVHSLRRLLNNMGFKWKGCQSKRVVLIERPDIVNWRCQYLKQIKLFREQSREIVYLDESWVDSNLTFNKCWQRKDTVGVLKNNSSSNRLILVHAGSRNGFVPNALLIFKAGKVTGDYHGQMNSQNFDKWIAEKLLPNLPEKSVIVMDNAPYHCIQNNKPPSKYALKKDMELWLSSNKIPFNETMRKSELMNLINQHKPTNKIYKIDEQLKSHGHEVLRLPPYMCDLSPIELIWAQAKRKLREQNITGDLSLTKLENSTKEAFSQISKQDWISCCDHVEKLEKDYWEKDGIMETAMEQFIINIGEDTSDEESDSGSGSDTFFDDDDFDLAQQLPEHAELTT